MSNKRVTIVDVAAQAGVAISSVSAALNDRAGVSEETRVRVKQVASELGFKPSLRARSLSSKKSFAVGLVVERIPEILETDPFFASFIGGVEAVLSSCGYALVLEMGRDKADTEQRYRQLAADRRVDGVFLSEIEIDDYRIDLLRELQLPAVALNPDEGDFPFVAVRQSGENAIRQLVRYFVDNGHTNFVHVAGPHQYVHSRQRRTAWLAALHESGQDGGAVYEGDFTYESGQRAAAAMAHSLQPATAVFCANDLMALGFLAQVQDEGFAVPRDISVAGYDGIQLGNYVRPNLTTLKTTPRAIAAESARLLIDLIEHRPVSDSRVSDVELMVRGSTGRRHL